MTRDQWAEWHKKTLQAAKDNNWSSRLISYSGELSHPTAFLYVADEGVLTEKGWVYRVGPLDPPDPATNCSFEVDEEGSEPPVGCDHDFPDEAEIENDDE